MVKTNTLTQTVEEKNSQIKELQNLLEMHSVGTQESIRGHVQEKERIHAV